MSAKRYLLIALCLGAVALAAQMSGWAYSSAYSYKNLYGQSITGCDVNKVLSIPLGVYDLEVENRLSYTDAVYKMDADNRAHERLDDRLQLSLSRKLAHAYARVWYRGEYYAKPTFVWGWQHYMGFNEPMHQRTYNQQAGFTGNYTLGKITAAGTTTHRTIYYDSVQDAAATIRQYNNLTGKAELDYLVTEPLTVFVSGSRRAFLNAPSDSYDYSTAGTGIRLNYPVSYTSHLMGESRIEWLEGDLLSQDPSDTSPTGKVQTAERLIPVTSQLRYNQLCSPRLTGFISAINRSFYDREQQTMLLNSNYLRGSLKYSFVYDLSLGSFVEAGGKLCPQDERKYQSSAYFLKTELKTLDKLYVGAGFNALPQRLTRYEGLVRWFFMPWNEAFVSYSYIQDADAQHIIDQGWNDLLHSQATQLTAGLRMMF